MQSVQVESIFGLKTKQGIVCLSIDDEAGEPLYKVQLSILDAKKMAYMILECAEGAATDAALFKMFENLKLPLEAAAMAIQQLRSDRPKQDPMFFES